MISKSLFLKQYDGIKTVFIATLLSITLLTIRLKMTHDFYILFMGWNLILALVPYVLSLKLLDVQNQNSTKSNLFVRLHLAGLGVIWLLFLPNAPYMITDLIHVSNTAGSIQLYDFILISTFAITGMIAAVQSIRHMIMVYNTHFKTLTMRRQKAITHALWWLCALGVYLGRVLRWNSWNIINKPRSLFNDVIDLFLSPLDHLGAWLFILAMGTFMSLIQQISDTLQRHD